MRDSCGDREEYALLAGRRACENCVVAPPPPVLGLALRGKGFPLRSGRFLHFGTRLRRAPAGGGVATQLDAPWVTVLSPPPTRPSTLHPGGLAALVTRTRLRRFARGGLFFLPSWTAGAVQRPWGSVFSFPGALPSALPQGSWSGKSSVRPERTAGKHGGASGSACARAGYP